MKNKAIIILAVLTAVGCGNKEDAKPTDEIQSQATNNDVVTVENTERPDYGKYRRQWIRVNSHPTEGYRLVDGKTVIDGRTTKTETVELNLDELGFANAFRLEYLGKGEGNTFWWRGNEYTTNLLDVVTMPVFHEEPIEPEVIIPIVIEEDDSTKVEEDETDK